MAIIKCKMCGGDMELTADQRCGTCEYCGSTMTLPKVDDEQRAAAFNRGNHFRRIGEFDKALTVYERIVQEDDGDAEAHWCCALCRFGIEYVKDPASGEYLPTCHRASFDSFLEDVDYKAALEHADAVARRQYQKDGEKIAQVQRGILSVSQKEQPFDVFICYKESDDLGNRTVDSTLAQDIYYQLTDEGFRVFFSRITLEDKAGQAYEPYIFAALHSAKVMIVVGTKPEYLNAVWVKNEWSRYLSIVKNDRKKLLIPCYRDMDPYDMPEQLSVLQSYDMSKIGFVQDLIRGISKVLVADKKPKGQETVIVQSESGANFDALLKRGYMALEDKSWQKADEFFEQVLNMNAECAEAYVGKLLALLKQPSLSKLVRQRVKQPDAQTQTRMAQQVAENQIQEAKKRFVIPGYLEEKDVEAYFAFDLTYSSAQRYRQEQLEGEIRYWNEAKLYQRALSFAGEGLKKELQEAVDTIIEARKQALEQAKAEDEANVERIKQAYLEHLEQTKELLQERYADALKKKEEDRLATEKQAKKQAEEARLAAEKQRKLEAQRKAKNKKIGIIAGITAVCLAIVGMVFNRVIIPWSQYKAAEELLAQGDYRGAALQFGKASGYKDAGERSFALWEAVYDESIIINSFCTIGLKPDGTVVATGDNEYGQCDVDDWTGIVAIASYGSYTVGLKLDGTVVATGDNEYGQCDVDDWTDIVAITTGNEYTVGLKADGTVVATGVHSNGRCDVDGWTDIVAIAMGYQYTVGLKSDGTVVATGDNEYGQCDVDDWTDIVAIDTGNSCTVGLKSDGTVVATGKNEYGQCDVADWTGIVAIDTYGSSYTMGLKSDGTVVATGKNEYGQCDVAGWTDIVAVSVDGSYMVGLRADGTVVATGDNEYGQCDVAGWTDIVAVSIDGGYTVGLRADGTVVATGDNEHGQCDVNDWTDIVAVFASGIHTVGLKSDGTVVATGKNDDGQCNVSDWTDIKVPNK